MGNGMVYHYHMCSSGTPCLCPRAYKACSSGTPCLCPRAYKACVGRISCRCGTKVSSPKGENPDLPRRLKTKTLRAWLPKEDNKLAGVWTKSSPTLTYMSRIWSRIWYLQIISLILLRQWFGHLRLGSSYLVVRMV